MMIQYVLTKAEWDDYHEANHILSKIKAILATSGIYNHELSIPAMTMYLVAKNDELNASHKTLKEVTEQRDRLAEALIKCREDSVCEQARMDTDTLRSIDTNEQIKTIIFDARMALHNAHLYLRTAEIISRKHGGNPTIGEPLSEATARCKGDDGIPAIISRIKSNLSSKQNNTQTP